LKQFWIKILENIFRIVHSNMMICCSRNISDYHQCWKQSYFCGNRTKTQSADSANASKHHDRDGNDRQRHVSYRFMMKDNWYWS